MWISDQIYLCDLEYRISCIMEVARVNGASSLPTLYDVHNGNIDISTILDVFSLLVDQLTIPKLDFNKVTSGVKKFGLIDHGTFDQLLLKYATFRGLYKDKLCLYLQEILDIVSFVDFCLVLSNVGYPEVCDALLAMRNRTANVIKHRYLPHAELIHAFYITLKRCADDNAFQFGPKFHFEGMISEFSKRLTLCTNPGKRQIISDKLVALFFLLAKQYSDVTERNETVQRMRAIMPHDVDRTTFDAVFHSHMALNWAIQGDVVTSDKHEQLARMACDTCSPCLATAAMRLNSQCKNNRLFYAGHPVEYLKRGYFDFEKGMQSSVNFNDEERRIWSTISTLEMCHSLLGINLYLEVCNIDNIDNGHIERAGAILKRFEEPKEIRRRMFYKLAMGRLHERDDPSIAKAYIHEALVLTSEGCYKDIEKRNIQNYLDTLVSRHLPPPSL